MILAARTLAALALLIGGQGVVRPGEPIDWDALPALPFRTQLTVTPEMSDYVVSEMRTGNCGKPINQDGRMVVRADVAVLVTADATIRATIPRAIDCATVEQYAAGLVSSFARNNLILRPGASAGWYRASVIFDWPQ